MLSSFGRNICKPTNFAFRSSSLSFKTISSWKVFRNGQHSKAVPNKWKDSPIEPDIDGFEMAHSLQLPYELGFWKDLLSYTGAFCCCAVAGDVFLTGLKVFSFAKVFKEMHTIYDHHLEEKNKEYRKLASLVSENLKFQKDMIDKAKEQEIKQAEFMRQMLQIAKHVGDNSELNKEMIRFFQNADLKPTVQITKDQEGQERAAVDQGTRILKTEALSQDRSLMVISQMDKKKSVTVVNKTDKDTA